MGFVVVVLRGGFEVVVEVDGGAVGVDSVVFGRGGEVLVGLDPGVEVKAPTPKDIVTELLLGALCVVLEGVAEEVVVVVVVLLPVVVVAELELKVTVVELVGGVAVVLMSMVELEGVATEVVLMMAATVGVDVVPDDEVVLGVVVKESCEALDGSMVQDVCALEEEQDKTIKTPIN